MYLALTGSASQERVISAAGEAVLPEEMQIELGDIMVNVRKRAKERNRIIHCEWGVSSEYPNEIINLPPENTIKQVVTAAHIHKAFDPGLDTLTDFQKDFIANLRIYTKQDFLNIAERLQETINLIGDFDSRVVKQRTKRRELFLAQAHQPEEAEENTPQVKPQTNPEDPV